MLVVIHSDHAKASDQAARIVANQVRRKPVSVLGLPTGNSPLAMYSILC
jgi:glucosamine-6-phosphate deaminase